MITHEPPPAATGLGIAAVTATATALYLTSIEIDDGLEGLIGLPILAVVSAVVSAVGAWHGAQLKWSVLSTLTACGTLAGIMLILGFGRGADPVFLAAVLGSVPILLSFGGGGAVLGHALAAATRDRSGRWRPPGDAGTTSL